MGIHTADGSPMDLSRRHSYDVVPSHRGFGEIHSSAHSGDVTPGRSPSDGPGRMSLGSLMDGHVAQARALSSARQQVKMEDRPEIDLDEEEEEDELADELEGERREAAI